MGGFSIDFCMFWGESSSIKPNITKVADDPNKTYNIHALMAIEMSYNWWFLWDYTFYKWSFSSTYNWYNSGQNCGFP
jgi:hypothetical protein